MAEVTAEQVVRSVRDAAAAAIFDLLQAQPPPTAHAQVLVSVPTSAALLACVGHTGYTDPVEIKVIARQSETGMWEAARWSIFDNSETDAVWHDGEFQPYRD